MTNELKKSNKKKAAYIAVVIVAVLGLSWCGYDLSQTVKENQVAEAHQQQLDLEKGAIKRNCYDIIELLLNTYQGNGCISDKNLKVVNSYLDNLPSMTLEECQKCMEDLLKIKEEAEELQAEQEAAAETAYYGESVYYEEPSTGYFRGDKNGLNTFNGVNYYNGRKETFYSQKVLPGGGLDIPGRHVDDQGVIRDGDGYVVVAASDLPKGTVIDTSLGEAKVYDSGCAPGVTDVYTDW